MDLLELALKFIYEPPQPAAHITLANEEYLADLGGQALGCRSGGSSYQWRHLFDGKQELAVGTIGAIVRLRAKDCKIPNNRPLAALVAAHSVRRTARYVASYLPGVRKANGMRERCEEGITKTVTIDMAALVVNNVSPDANMITADFHTVLGGLVQVSGYLSTIVREDPEIVEARLNFGSDEVRPIYAFGSQYRAEGVIQGLLADTMMGTARVFEAVFPANLGPGDSGAAVFTIKHDPTVLELVGILVAMEGPARVNRECGNVLLNAHRAHANTQIVELGLYRITPAWYLSDNIDLL